MKKDRGTKILVLIAICVAVVGMTVGFATFSTVLRIEGTGTVKSRNWSVIFTDLQAVAKTGTATQITAPTIQADSTTISNYQVELSTPGDSISYTFDIRNQGTFDAQIASISIAGTEAKPFAVTGSGTNKTTDETNVKNNLTYTLTYVGGVNDGQELAVGDTLTKRIGTVPGSVTVRLTLSYKTLEDVSLLPQADVTIDNLGVEINYIQI